GSVVGAPAGTTGEAELDLARQWRYDPALKDGRPVAARIVEILPVQVPLQAAATSDAQKYFETGQTLIRGGKYSEALAALDRAIASDPRLDRAYYQKALALVASSPLVPGGKVAVRPGA